jgi:RNA polymerase sigma factor (sigma-70 family)
MKIFFIPCNNFEVRSSYIIRIKIGSVLKSLLKHEYNRLLEYTKFQISDFTNVDAEDVLHEVAFNIFNKIDFESVVENIAAYLYKSIKNKIIDIIRNPRKTISLNTMIDNENNNLQTDLLKDHNESVEQKMERKELYKLLYQAINSLPPDYYNIIMATEFEGRTMKELSEDWEVPLGTLLSRRHRALAMLFKKLENYYT